VIKIFSKANPAGDIVFRDLYSRFLIVFLVVGLLVSAKRLRIGLHLGKTLVSVLAELKPLSNMVRMNFFKTSGRRLFGKFSTGLF